MLKQNILIKRRFTTDIHLLTISSCFASSVFAVQAHTTDGIIEIEKGKRDLYFMFFNAYNVNFNNVVNNRVDITLQLNYENVVTREG